MPNNDILQYKLRKFRRVEPVYIAAAFVAFGAISVYTLRANNLRMLELKQQLYDADKSGADVQKPLQDLQQYVLHHMNTSLATESIYPPIQLKNTYDRLVAAEKSRVDGINGSLYTEAQNYCEAQVNAVLGRDKIPCIEQYLQDNQAVQATVVPDGLYKFDFVAPKWSPDIAGWSVVITIFIGILLVSRIVAGWWYKRKTR